MKSSSPKTTFGPRKTIDDCHAIAKERGGLCLSSEYKNNYTKLKWKCAEGHEWEAIYANVHQGRWCWPCSRKRVALSKNSVVRDYSIEGLGRYALVKGGRYLTTENVGSKRKGTWQCSKGHQWSAVNFSVVYLGSWCPECYRHENPSESQCRRLFETIFNRKFPSIRPKWLVNPDTGFSLELDGYNEELKLAFEHQGSQHYEFVSHFFDSKEEFEALKARDQVKKEMLEKLGIVTIYIPQLNDLLPYEELETFVLDKLISAGILIPPREEWVEPSKVRTYRESTSAEVKERIKRNNEVRKNKGRDILTKEDVSLILRLQREGHTQAEICRIVNQGSMAVYKVFNRLMKRKLIAEIEFEELGIPIPTDVEFLQKRLSKDDVTKILELRNQGRSLESISSKFGISPSHIGRICNRHFGSRTFDNRKKK